MLSKAVRQHKHPYRFLTRQPDPGVQGVIVEGWGHTDSGSVRG